MPTITGQRTTGNVAPVQRYIDIAPDILSLEPEATPLTVITKRMKDGGNVKSAGDFEYSWVESERDVRFDAINKSGGYEATTEELIVDTEDVFAVGQLLTVPRTGEIMYVTGLPGSSKIKVTRGYSGTTKAALNDNDPIFVIGRVAEEGDTSFSGRSKGPTKITNYTEIFRTSIEATGSWMSSKNQTNPHDWVFQHKEKNREHLLDIEHAALFGRKATTTGTNGRRISTTGGVLSFLTENNQDAGGTLTEAEWESWVRAICRYGNQKTAFVSPLVLSVINNFAVGRLQTIQADKDKTYGIAITKYISAHGEVNLVKHNLLEGATWGGMAIAVDYGKAAPGYRFLGGGPGGGRDTKLLTNRQENDRDGQKDEILTECGFEFPQVKHGGVLTGVTS
jgi:hypothetical protein